MLYRTFSQKAYALTYCFNLMNRRQYMVAGGMAVGRLFTPNPTATDRQAQSQVAMETPAHADYVVTTTAELHAAFDAVEDGETILITGENSPYRTTQFLDIDASDVTVIGEGPRPLIRVADGANVGGIRIGYHKHVENITICGVSYDGNPEGQTLRRGGFGIGSFDAVNTTIEGCDIRRTVPYHEHNRFNSGIIITTQTRGFAIVNNRFVDIGDRAINAHGRFGYIAGNFSEQGFDRMISCEAGEELIIHGNRLTGNDQGSMIGISARTTPTNIVITGNIATGPHRRLVRVGDLAARTRVTIANNLGDGRDSPHAGIEVDTNHAIVAGNILDGYDGFGITVNAPRTLIRDNSIQNCGRHSVELQPATRPLSRRATGENGSFRSVVQGNVLRNNGRRSARYAEISVRANECRIMNNNIVALRDGRVCFDNPKGERAVFAWNVVPPGARLFKSRQGSARIQGNIR
jgi:hypothetical protein